MKKQFITFALALTFGVSLLSSAVLHADAEAETIDNNEVTIISCHPCTGSAGPRLAFDQGQGCNNTAWVEKSNDGKAEFVFHLQNPTQLTQMKLCLYHTVKNGLLYSPGDGHSYTPENTVGALDRQYDIREFKLYVLDETKMTDQNFEDLSLQEKERVVQDMSYWKEIYTYRNSPHPTRVPTCRFQMDDKRSFFKFQVTDPGNLKQAWVHNISLTGISDTAALHQMPGYEVAWEESFTIPRKIYADTFCPLNKEGNPTLRTDGVDSALPEGWTQEDKDGDGKGWGFRAIYLPLGIEDHYAVTQRFRDHCSDYKVLSSESYADDGPVSNPAENRKKLEQISSVISFSEGTGTVNNWLYTPEFNVGSDYKLTFAIAGAKLLSDDHIFMDSQTEYLKVYAIEEGKEPVQLGKDFITAEYWRDITVDLSSYAGKKIKIAFANNGPRCHDMALDCVKVWRKKGAEQSVDITPSVTVVKNGETVTTITIGHGVDGFDKTHFKSLTVDGNTVLEGNDTYTLRDGSILIDFSSAFLATLSVGDHPVVVTLQGDGYEGKQLNSIITVQDQEDPSQTDEDPSQTDEDPSQTDEDPSQTGNEAPSTDAKPSQSGNEAPPTDVKPSQLGDDLPRTGDETFFPFFFAPVLMSMVALAVLARRKQYR